jgi:hypothetical protein
MTCNKETVKELGEKVVEMFAMQPKAEEAAVIMKTVLMMTTIIMKRRTLWSTPKFFWCSPGHIT